MTVKIEYLTRNGSERDEVREIVFREGANLLAKGGFLLVTDCDYVQTLGAFDRERVVSAVVLEEEPVTPLLERRAG